MKKVTKREIRNYGAIRLTGCNIYTYENAISAICANDLNRAPMHDETKQCVIELLSNNNFYKATYHTEMYSSGVYGCTGRVDRIEFMNEKWDIIDTCEVKFFE